MDPFISLPSLESSGQFKTPMNLPVVSFHQLKDDKNVTAKTRMQEAADLIWAKLEDYLKLTKAAVQSRSDKALHSLGRRTLAEMKDRGERNLEERIFIRWGQNSTEPFLTGCCQCLIKKQVPLYSSEKSESWGKIDLLGRSASSEPEPVVIELKAKEAGDSPLRAMIEGVGYAIALRENWGYFRGELEKQTKVPWREMTRDSRIWIVVVAPEEFWQRLSRSDPSKAALPSLQRLEEKLSAAGYPVHFASVRDKENEGVSTPRFWTIAQGYFPFPYEFRRRKRARTASSPDSR